MDITELVGKTFDKVYVSPDEEELHFESTEGHYMFFHSQDCCENVRVEDIAGDLADLEGTPLVVAEVECSNDLFEGKPTVRDSFTWTFYKFRTIKGSVTVRWLGESNGYYSESVSFREVK